jgi:hypothetical protein
VVLVPKSRNDQEDLRQTIALSAAMGGSPGGDPVEGSKKVLAVEASEAFG